MKVLFPVNFPLTIVLVLIVLSSTACITSGGVLLETTVAADSAKTEERTEPENGGGSEEEQNGEEPEEEPALHIKTDPDGAEVSLNGAYTGETPLTITGLASGTYNITIEKEGYRKIRTVIDYQAGTQYYIDYNLDPITGYLDVDVFPENADVYVDGVLLSGGVAELLAGIHRVDIGAFGYRDVSRTVFILEKATTTLKVVMEEVPFDFSYASGPLRDVNPYNPGALGFCTISFGVTAPGSGTVVIYSEEKEQVYSAPLPRFTEENNRIAWNARLADGSIAPEGLYSVTISGSGKEKAEKTVTTSFVINYSAVIAYRSLWSGGPGLLFCPDGISLPDGAAQVSFSVQGNFFDADLYRVPLQIGIRFGLPENAEIDLSATGILSPDNFPVNICGAFQVSLADFASVVTKLTYTGGTTADTQHNFTGLSVGVPLRIGTDYLKFVLAPDLCLSYTYPTYTTVVPEEFSLWFYLRGGILFEAAGFQAGLSASVRTASILKELNIHYPVSAGIELSYVLPKTNLAVSLAFSGEFHPVDGFYIMTGGGLHLLY